MIQQIEELRAELQPPAFRDGEIFENRPIQVPLARAAQNAPPRVAVGSGRRGEKRCLVDVTLQVVLGGTRRMDQRNSAQYVRIVITIVIRGRAAQALTARRVDYGERVARLRDEEAIQRPVVEKSFAESAGRFVGQILNPSERQPLRPVKVRRPLREPNIVPRRRI